MKKQKTLVVILQYNSNHYTDPLFEELNKYKKSDYDIIVIDNGSDKKDKISKYTTHTLSKNVFYGGGLNIGFQFMLENKQYDSLLFLNNDIIVSGYNFVNELKANLFNNKNTMIVSPCILQPYGKCYWSTMHNWQSNKMRFVKWVDFQAPMFKREFIEKIKQYDNDLIYGWGNDVYSGMICEDNNWNIAVIDWVSIIHWDGGTINKEKKLKNYNNKANFNMFNFFKKINRFEKFIDYRKKARNYTYDL